MKEGGVRKVDERMAGITGCIGMKTLENLKKE
jgi:hypothetical protein